MALSTSRLKGVIKTLTLSFLPPGWPDSSPLSPSQKADIDAKIDAYADGLATAIVDEVKQATLVPALTSPSGAVTGTITLT